LIFCEDTFRIYGDKLWEFIFAVMVGKHC
jgi:hypothetical protein